MTTIIVSAGAALIAALAGMPLAAVTVSKRRFAPLASQAGAAALGGAVIVTTSLIGYLTGHLWTGDPATASGVEVLAVMTGLGLAGLAAGLGHDEIGTGHLLLGLVGERDGITAQVLAQFGADLERVRLQVAHWHDDEESERRLHGPAAEDQRVALRVGSDRVIVDHPGQPADYVHTDGTVWTWHERWHLIGGVRDGDRTVGQIHLRAYDPVNLDY